MYVSEKMEGGREEKGRGGWGERDLRKVGFDGLFRERIRSLRCGVRAPSLFGFQLETRCILTACW